MYPFGPCFSLAYMPKSGIAGSYGSSIFSFLRNHHCCCLVIKLYLMLCEPMNPAHQASLSFTVSESLLKLVSIGTSILFSIVAIPIYIPTNRVQESSLLSTSSPAFSCLCIFWWWPFWLVCISHCSLDLHFLVTSNIEHLFMCLLTIHISSLEKCLFRSSAHLLSALFLLMLLSILSYL